MEFEVPTWVQQAKAERSGEGEEAAARSGEQPASERVALGGARGCEL